MSAGHFGRGAVGIAWIALAVVCGVLLLSPAVSAQDKLADDAAQEASQDASDSTPSDLPADDATSPVAGDENALGGPASAPVGDELPVDDESTPSLAAPAGRAVPGAASNTHIMLMVLLVAAVFIVPIWLGNWLAKRLRMPDHATKMSVVLFSILASTVVTVFGWPPKLGIDLSGGVILIYEIEDKDFKEMDKLVGAINKRINPGGIKEVTVRPFGQREVEIIIPEADENQLEQTKHVISTTGQLEFRIVADRRYDQDVIERATESEFVGQRDVFMPEDEEDQADDESASEKRQPVAQWVPVTSDEAPRFAANSSGNYAVRPNKRGEIETLVLIDRENVTGDYLSLAAPGIDTRGRPCVNFGFNGTGARLFGRLTSSNLPDPLQPETKYRELAIVLDGMLRSSPRINSRIEDRGEISGSFTQQEVEDLSQILLAGRLPAKLRKEPTSSMQIGPTLGRETQQSGIYSMLVSTVAVIVFMVIYYRFAGIVANLALLLNVLLIVAFMVLFHAAFTLSGLAGLALTVGMAVDANVLIYERMREELARGATLRMAIRNGFERASTTIVDANVTTLISAIVLYIIGTDQVKGFAVTLILGIVMNLFTAITFSRLIFDVAERQRWITQLRMLKILENPNFDFIGKWRLAIGLSLLTIGVGLGAVAERGRGLLDIDFTGGVSVETLFEKPQDIALVRERVADLPDVTVNDLNIRGEQPGLRFLVVTSKSDIDETEDHPTGPKTNIEYVETELKNKFSDPGHELAVNHLTWTSLQAIPSAGEKTDAAGDEKSKPQAEEGAGLLPSDETLLALADDDPASAAQPSDGDAAAEVKPPQDQPAEAQPAAESVESESGQAQEKSEPSTTGTPAAGAKAAEPPSDEERPTQPAAKAAGAKGPPARPRDPFAGGTTSELSFTVPIDHESLAQKLRDSLPSTEHDVPLLVDNREYETGSKRGFKNWTLKIVLPAADVETALAKVKQDLAERPVFPSSNKVGASVAGATQLQATYALLAALALIIVYVWIRFQQVSFGFAAVIAVIHDVLVALGALALSYWLADLSVFKDYFLVEPYKISLPVIAAFLTIIGYSINDTIVIFDRIRELRGKSPELGSNLVNLCVNQTLSRTLLTSLTVFIVVLILYFFGGQGIHAFAFTLVIGTISGTYSTVYIATPILIWMNRSATAKKPAPTAVASRAA